MTGSGTQHKLPAQNKHVVYHYWKLFNNELCNFLWRLQWFGTFFHRLAVLSPSLSIHTIMSLSALMGQTWTLSFFCDQGWFSLQFSLQLHTSLSLKTRTHWRKYKLPSTLLVALWSYQHYNSKHKTVVEWIPCGSNGIWTVQSEITLKSCLLLTLYCCMHDL